MPVVALATTEAPDAVPAAAGVLSTRVDRLAEGARALLADPDRARAAGSRRAPPRSSVSASRGSSPTGTTCFAEVSA